VAERDVGGWEDGVHGVRGIEIGLEVYQKAPREALRGVSNEVKGCG